MNPHRAFARFRLKLSRHARALAFGIAAAVAVSLPPFELAGRLDAKLYDLWVRLERPAAADDILLVSVTDPVWLTALAELAARRHSRLVVTTLPAPPSTVANDLVLGPTEVPIGDQLIRRTEWRHGGHLSFRPDDDGLIRSLPPWLDGDTSLPSLAVTAARSVAPATIGARPGSRLRLIEPSAYRHVSPDELAEDPALVADAIVVAGRPELRYATPAGVMAAHQLLAQAIDGYRRGSMIASPGLVATLPWALAIVALCAMLVVAGRGRARRAALCVTGCTAVVAAGAAGFLLASLWIPVAAPLTLLAAAGIPLLERTPRLRKAAPQTPVAAAAILSELATGNVEQAWKHVCDMPADRSTLDDLCEVAAALESSRYMELAADVYHRVAQVDPRHRDVAGRLLRASQTPGEREAARAAFAELPVPSKLARYEILEPIGRGSTGMVHLAVDPTINRLVALKVFDLGAEYGNEALGEGLERFHREASSAGRLKHPNIVTVFDIGESEGLAFIAMEFLQGRHLSHFTTPDNLLPPRLVLEIGAQIAEALDYAHSRNVIHRDIKPGNIMYDSVSGAATITDFGIARLIDVCQTRTGIVLGTPSFMAPEQLEGKNVNRHTDLFALGVTLYELLTGRLPFLGASMTKLMFVITNEPHPPVTALRPDFPLSMNSLFDHALAKRPEDRFADGAEMAAALRLSAAQLV